MVHHSTLHCVSKKFAVTARGSPAVLSDQKAGKGNLPFLTDAWNGIKLHRKRPKITCGWSPARPRWGSLRRGRLGRGQPLPFTLPATSLASRSFGHPLKNPESAPGLRYLLLCYLLTQSWPAALYNFWSGSWLELNNNTANNWTRGAARRYTTAPISHTRPSPHSPRPV